MDPNDRLFGEVIHSYTRQQAIEDGVLVDVFQLAKEAGIRFHTAITSAVWNKYVAVPDGVIGQDEVGRLWDILYMFRMTTNRYRLRFIGDEVLFRLHVRNDNREGIPPLVTLKVVYSPGDKGEPVITIMLPDED